MRSRLKMVHVFVPVLNGGVLWVGGFFSLALFCFWLC
jgi:hypothetical protein